MLRWGTAGSVLAGVAWAFSGVVASVFADTVSGDPTGTLYFYLFEGTHAVADVGMLAALLGFHARQAPAYGRLGTAGFVLAFVGTTGVLFSGTVWLALLHASEALIFTVIWDAALLCWLAGFPLIGIATFRTKMLPRWSGSLLVAYFPLLSVAVSFDGQGGMMLLFLTLVGLLWLALGYALWAWREAPAGHPSRAKPATQKNVGR